MLRPDDRSLVTGLLTPPPGMVLNSAIATTYTLDPITLLTMPLHLAWLSGHAGGDKMDDGGLHLLEGLRRVSDKLTVYADRGRIQTPARAHALYSMLENIIVEVRAPGRGAFHPKLWLLRFVDDGEVPEVRLRLGILSRNMTADRCWDLSLQLEGTPGKRNVAANRELSELITDLPNFAVGSVTGARIEQARRLGDELRKTPWELPGNWSEVVFHVLGRKSRAWSPPDSSEMVVISPFLTAGALDHLCATTTKPIALVSRPDQLAMLTEDLRKRFGRCLVLDEAAESEDGEDASDRQGVGLHAKALILTRGRDTHLFVGSVNATAPAMLNNSNIEVWAELIGQRSKVDGIEQLLSDDGLGSLLTDFDSATPLDAEEESRRLAEVAMDAVRGVLVEAVLVVDCAHSGNDWCLRLKSSTSLSFGDVSVSAWPLSVNPNQARPLPALAPAHDLDLGTVATADVTGLIGFSLQKDGYETRFALNLPVTGLPADRDAAIIRRVIQNRDGFLRYLMLLLGESEDGMDSSPGKGGAAARWAEGGWNHLALLEELVRAYTRDKDRLKEIRRLVERLGEGDKQDGIIPPEFHALWSVFEQAIEAAA